MACFAHFEIQGKLDRSICRSQAKLALQAARTYVINQRLIECLNYLIDRVETIPDCVNNTEFKRLATGYITWP